MAELNIFKSNKQLLETITYTLQSLVCETARRNQPKTPFHFSSNVTVSLPSYLQRIFRFMNCSKSCYIIALILLDRLKSASSIYTLTPRNVHKLFMSAILVSTKFNDDNYYSQAYYAQVAGLKLKELVELEQIFLRELRFHTFVDLKTFQQYSKKLAALYEKNKFSNEKDESLEEVRTMESQSCRDDGLVSKKSSLNNSFSSVEN